MSVWMPIGVSIAAILLSVPVFDTPLARTWAAGTFLAAAILWVAWGLRL